MAQARTGRFTRKGPDMVAEELALALFGNPACEFKPLFTLVHATLRARNGASGGEEMLRLRVYEKLQDFVRRGMVDKKTKAGIKKYSALATLSSVLPLVIVPPIVA